MKKFNIVIAFNIGHDIAYLSRVIDSNAKECFTRHTWYGSGNYEYKGADAFKSAVKRYTDKYGATTKVILNGDQIDGDQAETLCEFILNEAL